MAGFDLRPATEEGYRYYSQAISTPVSDRYS